MNMMSVTISCQTYRWEAIQTYFLTNRSCEVGSDSVILKKPQLDSSYTTKVKLLQLLISSPVVSCFFSCSGKCGVTIFAT